MSTMRKATSGVLLTAAIVLSVSRGSEAQQVSRRSCPEFKVNSQDPIDRSRPLVMQFNLVRAIALKLREKGYRGRTDGVFTPELSNLVRATQKATKLPQTGDLDCATVKQLLQVDLNERRS